MDGYDKEQEVKRSEETGLAGENRDKDGKGEVSGKRNPAVRLLALFLILIYVVLLGIFIYMIVVGSKYIVAMLFVLIVYPVILYLLLWLRKVFRS